MLQTHLVEKITPHIVCSVTFFFRKSYRLWDNVKKLCRPGQATDDMRIACWIIKTKNTHSEYVILIAFHCNNVYANATQYYVVCTLLYYLGISSWNSRNKSEKIWKNDIHVYSRYCPRIFLTGRRKSTEIIINKGIGRHGRNSWRAYSEEKSSLLPLHWPTESRN
jgi:hypothetical protein